VTASCSDDNPLLDDSDLTRFGSIQPSHVAPAIHELLQSRQALIDTLAHSVSPDPTDEAPVSWDDFAQPLIDALEPLSRAWGIVEHFHSVNNITPWREAYNSLLPEVTRFYTELGQNEGLFLKYKALTASPEYANLGRARRKIIENELRRFRLAGVELQADQKIAFQHIARQLSELGSRFNENLLDSTNAFSMHIRDQAQLEGLPPDFINTASETARKAGQSGWLLSLQAPCYQPVMKLAESRELRARMYRAYNTRASEFTDHGSQPEWDNASVIASLRALQQEKARLLNFDHYAHYSLADKMAESPEEVIDFIRELAVKARPCAERDIAGLREFASRQLGLFELEAWDIAFAGEKLRRARYNFSEQDVKNYFNEAAVLNGLFDLVERLFGVKLIEVPEADIWRSDVRLYHLRSDAGKPVGHLYMDLFAHPEKNGGAWMNEERGRRARTPGQEQLSSKACDIQTPVAYICCNFSRPLDDGPVVTLSHDEVLTLLHETGHALHHLLAQGLDLPVSGINGVEWDAVELPSQFMEHYGWEWSVLSRMSAHIEHGRSLPRELFDKMLAAKNFLSGLVFVRQLELALFDMRLYCEPEASTYKLLDEVRKEIAVVVPPDWNRFPNGFSHIFGGGYAAGYYSYKWAEVLSADIYAAFIEAGDPFDETVSRRLYDEIFSIGGERTAIENFIAFRGRKPDVTALLRDNGLIESHAPARFETHSSCCQSGLSPKL